MPEQPAPAENRRARSREIHPERVTAAALALFLERGFARTRMEDVARRAGVSKGAIYLHFDNKEDLFRAVVREGIVSRIEQAERRLCGVLRLRAGIAEHPAARSAAAILGQSLQWHSKAGDRAGAAVSGTDA